MLFSLEHKNISFMVQTAYGQVSLYHVDCLLITGFKGKYLVYSSILAFTLFMSADLSVS